MLVEEKSQELKGKKWLEERNDESLMGSENGSIKRVKPNDKLELKKINRMWALPEAVKLKKIVDDCIFSAVVDEGLRQNDIRYPCYLCGPNTSGFSRARDLMRHFVSVHDLFPSRVEQGKHYVCDGRDLVKLLAEQYERYNDESHRGKKKLEGVDKVEIERKRVEPRTKAGERAKKDEVVSTVRKMDLAELMRKREEQVEIQNAGKIEARKREELLEQEREAAEKKIQLGEQQRAREKKKRRAKEDWQKQIKAVEEEKKREDKVQFNLALSKTLAQQGGANTLEAKKVLKVLRRELTSEELDQEFRELNAGQVRANIRAVVEELSINVGGDKKEKSAAVEKQMMRAEGEVIVKLPPATVLLDKGSANVGATDHVQAVKGRVAKKVMKAPDPIVEEMELEGGEVEIDFEGERAEVHVVEIPQDILDVVVQTIQEERQGSIVAPVESISVVFLESLVSDGMDVDLGDEEEERVREIAHELEESGRGVENFPSREIKEELIEEDMMRENRKTGDGKISSDSAEELDRITIDDSAEVKNFMIRATRYGNEEPEPPRDILTPTLKSTPYVGHEREVRKLRLVIAPKKKLWVQTGTGEDEPEEEDDRKSSIDSAESEVRRSPLSAVSSGRAVDTERGVPLHLREPHAFGDRATRTHVRFNDLTGMREVNSELGGDEMLTGGGDGDREMRVRRVTARLWLEGYGSDEDEGVEDIDDQLYLIIDGMPFPWTISRALRIAVQRYPQRAPWYLRMKLSTIMMTMRRTSQNILTRCIRTAPAVNQQTSMIVPLNLDVLTRYFDTSN